MVVPRPVSWLRMTEWHGEEGQTNQDELVHNASLGVVSTGNENLGVPPSIVFNLTCLTEKGLIPQRSVLVWCPRRAAAVFQAGFHGWGPLEILPPWPEKW